MSETPEAPEPQPLRLYKLGPWPEHADAPEATPLGNRLMAWFDDPLSVEVDADLSRIIRREFDAQEAYRQRRVKQTSLFRQWLTDMQAQLKADEGQPNGEGDSFAYGFSRGQQAAFWECAQQAQDVLNESTDEVQWNDRPPITPEFLRSPKYAEVMSAPRDGCLTEAHDVSPSYRMRHQDFADWLGVWRWRGVQRHAETILRELERPGARVLDFGGAGGPLGLGSQVVDLKDTDRYGRPVLLHSLADVENATCVFTSHALEHIPDIDTVLAQIAECLAPGGLLIAHVPAWTCERWRAGIHTSPDFAPHCWDFGIEDEAPIEGLRAYTNIAARIGRVLTVELSEYCGDDSIMVLARKASV